MIYKGMVKIYSYPSTDMKLETGVGAAHSSIYWAAVHSYAATNAHGTMICDKEKFTLV
jgi:hypothetical protein